MNITYAEAKDIAAIAAVEAACFPPAEAATEKEFVERVTYYGSHFWLLYEEGKLIAFVDGYVTDEPDLTDEMYAHASMHNADDLWGQYPAGLSPTRICRGTAPPCHRRCEAAGTKGTCADLQGKASSLLCQIWFC